MPFAATKSASIPDSLGDAVEMVYPSDVLRECTAGSIDKIGRAWQHIQTKLTEAAALTWAAHCTC